MGKDRSDDKLEYIVSVLEEYDPDEIVDLLEITSEELIDLVYEVIIQKKDYILETLGIDNIEED